jgi:sulfur carrier protein
MKLEVNGEALEVTPSATVADLVGVMGIGSRGVAVAVNSELLRRAAWPDVRLVEGDRVEILHAVAGG